MKTLCKSRFCNRRTKCRRYLSMAALPRHDFQADGLCESFMPKLPGEQVYTVSVVDRLIDETTTDTKPTTLELLAMAGRCDSEADEKLLMHMERS